MEIELIDTYSASHVSLEALNSRLLTRPSMRFFSKQSNTIGQGGTSNTLTDAPPPQWINCVALLTMRRKKSLETGRRIKPLGWMCSCWLSLKQGDKA